MAANHQAQHIEEIMFGRDPCRVHETIETGWQYSIAFEGNRLKTVDANAQIRFKNILVPTDFSKCSYTAMRYALLIARKYGSKLFVAHVVPNPLPTPRGSWNVTLDRADRAAQEAMTNCIAQLEGTSHEVLLRQGDVEHAF